jgi:hypothetical protein
MTDHIVAHEQDAGTEGTRNQPGGPADADDLREYWPGDTSPSVLTALRAEFPSHQITRQLFVGQVHYIACRLHPGTRPHTVITADPDKLRAALRAGQA